ncbi:hypothetical protein [Tenacibaculum jejuense]|uniref:Uncharacterized protein n=1 Tax=Tenacibaculum jejuense TaxID=584609 RepID=A0A238UA66_9FLAO|nr:hypothetical protein [Tenacibaculum jejuense]SNR16071.1 Protein of unknown function [Tenacibaculum jejuense]
MEIVFIISVISIYLFIFIWGYSYEFKKGPKAFFKTIIGMPIAMLLSYIGFPELDKKIKDWTEK